MQLFDSSTINHVHLNRDSEPFFHELFIHVSAVPIVQKALHMPETGNFQLENENREKNLRRRYFQHIIGSKVCWRQWTS